jgi:hypothetical protein
MGIDRIIRTQLGRGKDLIDTFAPFTAKHLIPEADVSIRTEFTTVIAAKTGCEWR